MRLSDLELRRLLPAFMRDDEAVAGLAQGVDRVVRDAAQRLPVLRKWDQIDSMTHEQLDEMAWELNTLWYDTGASIEVKRRLLKNSDRVYARLGTRWAVEEVIRTYFGDATMLEFWEYGGKPHYFMITTRNPAIAPGAIHPFLWALNIVKRKSQWLESVLLELAADGAVHTGPALQDTAWDTVWLARLAGDLSPPDQPLWTGVAQHEVAYESAHLAPLARDLDPPALTACAGMAQQDVAYECAHPAPLAADLDLTGLAPRAGTAAYELSQETVCLARLADDSHPPAVTALAGMAWHDVAFETIHITEGGGA